ncbi:hypothetical protein LCGC14_0141320 [marine sediment metagenome]|uniref:Uncharacterized protein n=1 Tax=marine sediment metagenome TaxID=412755 RepID=A0A0F9XI90_9ZZZZ
MPYIKEEEREKYDHLIDKLAVIFNGLDGNDELSGDLNYVIFRLAYLLTHTQTGGKRKYARMAVVLSALNEAGEEFRRRIMGPYEDEAITKNGDVQLKPQHQLLKPSSVQWCPNCPGGKIVQDPHWLGRLLCWKCRSNWGKEEKIEGIN